MGLRAGVLRLRDWRNLADREIVFNQGMTVLLGRNAVGKTNVVEALQLLTAGTSFRRAAPRDLVAEGRAHARAELGLFGDGRVVDVSCDIEDGRRTFWRNGKRVLARELSETMMSVLFCPDDLSLVKGSARGRRDELDGFGRQANAGYAKVLAAYQRSVEQRNRLLKDEDPDRSLLDAWDASVAVGAATLLQARLRLVARLRPHLARAYGEIASGEALTCDYECTAGEGADTLTRDELAARILSLLVERREEDLRRHGTSVGPHRDDLAIGIDGRPARGFASQGQQRSVVLAWKMAEVALAEEVVGERPLLLLDDVMSELDERRREAVVRFVQADMQTVVTTTHLGYFPEGLLRRATVVEMG